MQNSSDVLVDGVYNITINKTSYHNVYCAFDYINEFGWTLIESATLSQMKSSLHNLPWAISSKINENDVELYRNTSYRMSKDAMFSIKNISSYLFATCNFNISFENDKNTASVEEHS